LGAGLGRGGNQAFYKEKPRPVLGTRLLAVPPKLTRWASPSGPLFDGWLAVALVTEGSAGTYCPFQYRAHGSIRPSAGPVRTHHRFSSPL